MLLLCVVGQRRLLATGAAAASPVVALSRAVSLPSWRGFSSTSTSPRPILPEESFLNASNAVMLDEMYELWKRDPSAVSASFATYFEKMEQGVEYEKAVPKNPPPRPLSNKGSGAGGGTIASEKDLSDVSKLTQLIRSFRVRGHLATDLDPLGIVKPRQVPELDPGFYGFTDADWDRKFLVGTTLGLHPASESYHWQSMRDIVEKLRNAYCGKVGLEYFHITDPEQRAFLGEWMESNKLYRPMEHSERLAVLNGLIVADNFENFLKKKHQAAKRFGLEGGEALIPGLEMMVRKAAGEKMKRILIGMPHRGRLSVLGNIMEKPFRQIFSEFSGALPMEEMLVDNSGDVKYHLGAATKREINGHEIGLSVAANPSHLEAVNPVVVGKTRAKQHLAGGDKNHAMSVLIHGDAAFAGQGIVPETLAFSDLKHYNTGGTIHIVVNNQIGFTTDPSKARSTPYCSDVAKMVGAPILHVNGEDPEAVARCFELALDYRQKFHKDVVVDMYCYRKHGHNEGDEPRFTQPHMYSVIDKKPSNLEIYKRVLLEKGLVSKQEIEELENKFQEKLELEWEASKGYKPTQKDWLEEKWEGYKSMREKGMIKNTGVPVEVLRDLIKRMTKIPEGFELHKGVQKVYDYRRSVADAESHESIVNWGLGEQLAFATLLRENITVRLSGQDVERGTFSHRHAVVHDQNSVDKEYIPLSNLFDDQGTFRVANSHLSELAVLGFELGYSLESPRLLVLWEAQFGDFANGAQIIIDQYVASGEAKWNRQSGLVMLLPHGYEGQGPEHSSARLERFLQLSSDDPEAFPLLPSRDQQLQKVNWSVVNVTTPANFFHVLRRQIHRDYRKPLVVMSPKRLLRQRECSSSLDEFSEKFGFQEIIPEQKPETLVGEEDIKRVILCSGQIYYDLVEMRALKKKNDVAIVRVEEISPFPYSGVRDQVDKYPNAEVIWAQEECQNGGAWSFVEPRIAAALKDSSKRRPLYYGRETSASPATGFAKVHEYEKNAILEGALGISDAPPGGIGPQPNHLQRFTNGMYGS